MKICRCQYFKEDPDILIIKPYEYIYVLIKYIVPLIHEAFTVKSFSNYLLDIDT